MNDTNTFSKESSIKLKGIAIIMMLIHHCFRTADRFEGYSVLLFPLKEQQLINIAETCKICVSMFAFITGYGLFLNYQNHRGTAQRWVAKRYIKSFSGYWFIWIFCMIFSQLKDGRVTEILFTDGKPLGITYSLLSLLGINNIFGTPSIDYRWWYMSAAFLFIFITPVIYRYKNDMWMVLVGVILFLRVIISYDGTAVAISSESVYAFLVPYVLGAIFARYDFIDRWCSIRKKKPLIKMYRFAVEIWVIILLYKAFLGIPKYLFWEFHYGVFSLTVIMFFVEFILPIKFMSPLLIILGKNSMNIYLVHSLIQMYYPKLIYQNKHFAVSVLILLFVSICASVVLESLKKIIRYDKMITKIKCKIDAVMI